MAEVRVIARAVAKEGKEEELKALLRRMVKPTRAENGCRYYEFFESSNLGIFYFNELWESVEALGAHTASSHFNEIFAKAKELFKEPLEVNVLQEIQ